MLSSYPVKGAIVRPGILILRITFDKPMTCAGLLDARVGFHNPCPAPLISPLFSRDRRTFLTVCIVSPHGWGVEQITDNPYGLKLDKFISLSGQPLKPSDVDFYINPTSSPVETIKEAITQDKFLRDAEKAAERTE